VSQLAPTSRPTLCKVGADLRWLLEKSGIDAEKTLVTIGVPTKADKDRLSIVFANEFDAATMKRVNGSEYIIEVLGLNIIVVSTPEIAKRIPIKPAESA
jgi:hypothetical protein